MFNIALIFPFKFEKFYINPFYLQRIEGLLNMEISSKDISIVLLDRNTNIYYQQIAQYEFDLAIIDVAEGQNDDLETTLSEIKAKRILLVGDRIKYGKRIELLWYLHNTYKYLIYACIDDFSIADFVEASIKDGNIAKVSGLIYFNNNQIIQNGLYINSNKKLDKRIPLKFYDYIIASYENNGIQLFLDGISQGCENECSFCKLNNRNSTNHKVRPSFVDCVKTIKELQNYCKKRLFIQFTDENFFGGGISKLTQINMLSKELIKIKFNGILGIDTRLDTIINTDETDKQSKFRKDTWKVFSESGLRYCFIGVETFNHIQAMRYNKKLDLSNFKLAISFIEQINITYTIGLILWDPLMDILELKENLNYIKENNLLGKTASLLKIMRVQANSEYFYKNKFEISDKLTFSDYFNIDKECLKYKDDKVRNILPYINYIYKLFSMSGYRHSDVSLFSAIYDINTPQILKDIPYIIAKMEYDILQYLLNLKTIDDSSFVLKNIIVICSEVVQNISSCLDKLDIHNNYTPEIITVKHYYSKVFSKINEKLQEIKYNV